MPRTKVVVRNLPPGLPESAFKEAVDKGGFQGRYGYFDYVPGKVKPKLTTHSICYVNFKDEPALFEFSGSFNGHVFVDDKGAQFKSSVEYAPFQKVPKAKPRKDRREGTIEKDQEYQVSDEPSPILINLVRQ